MDKGNCEFRGSGAQYFPVVLIHVMILGALTLGIYGPWALCRLWRLKASHTRIRGQEVSFTGQGGEFLVLCLTQGILAIITLGIYAPWAIAKIIKWKTEHTVVSGRPSVFNGTGGSLFSLYLIHLVILPLITLGIYYLWGMYRFYAWKEEHSLYGGEKTSFGGSLGQFIKISILSWILNAVTFQLFTPWSMCWLYRWQIEGLKVGREEEVDHYPPVKTNMVAVAVLVVIGVGIMYGLITIVKHQVMTAYMTMNQMAKIASSHPSSQGKLFTDQENVLVKSYEAMGRVQRTSKRSSSNVKTLLASAINSLDTPEYYYNKALAFFSIGKYDEAIKNYSMAIGKNRKDPDVYYNRGVVYLNKGEYQKAIKDFGIAIRLDPNAADAYCNRAGANFQLGRLRKALADYTAAIKISPKDPDLYHNRALVYKAKGEMDKARADLDKERALRGKFVSTSRAVSVGNGSAIWRDSLEGVEVPTTPASGMIHGKQFQVQDAMLKNGILTLRQGNNFFADREIKIFTFKSMNEEPYGAVFRASKEQKYGVPHVHLSWMEKGRNLPRIAMYSGGYSMVLRIGEREGDFVPGSIYVCLPDDQHSFVAGTFKARIGRSSKKY